MDKEQWFSPIFHNVWDIFVAQIINQYLSGLKKLKSTCVNVPYAHYVIIIWRQKPRVGDKQHIIDRYG
jgi:hypothetical protein